LKRFQWDKKYLYWGLTALAVILSCIIFFMGVQRWNSIRAAIDTLARILSPFIWGFVIAYILNPVMRFLRNAVFDRLFHHLWRNSPKKAVRISRYSRALSITMAELLLLAIIAALLWLILPQLYYSLDTIVKNSQSFMNTIIRWVEMFLEDYPQIEGIIADRLGSLSDALVSWLENNVLPRVNDMLSNVTSGVYQLLRGVYNVVVGVIVSVYVLFNKTAFAASGRKILFALFSPRNARAILRGLSFTDGVVMDFITGKLLDSLIIAMICYLGCTVLGMPYTLLISVVVGVTNIIPFFGPFIGAIPATFLILMASPIKALIFVGFIFILQQFDGNILGPKILGSTTGINGFWVMFSIILGAGLFGFLGMLLGVPVFVVIYTGVHYLINERLKEKGLPTDTGFYAGGVGGGEIFPEEAAEPETGAFQQPPSAEVVTEAEPEE